MTVKTIPAFYDYEKQARLFIVKQGISDFSKATNEEYGRNIWPDALTPLLFENFAANTCIILHCS